MLALKGGAELSTAVATEGGPPVFTRTTITTTAAPEERMAFCGGTDDNPGKRDGEGEHHHNRVIPLTVIFLPKYPTMEKEVDYFPTHLAAIDALGEFHAAFPLRTTCRRLIWTFVEIATSIY